MKHVKFWPITTIGILGFIAGLSLGLCIGLEPQPVGKRPAANTLPSIAEVQQRLVDEYRAKITVDGKLGPATQRAWDKACCDQHCLALWPTGAKGGTE